MPDPIAVQPYNYREVEFTIDGVDIIVGGMARPDYAKRNPLESLTYLAEEKYNILIGLQIDYDYLRFAKMKNLEYIAIHVEDHQAPDIEIFDRAFNIVHEAAKNNQKVAIHCGEGFGRTGTVLAAIKLKSLLLDIPPEARVKQGRTEEIYVGKYGGHQFIKCTPLVKKAIDAIRAPRKASQSVEMKEHVEQLIKYQNKLILQLGVDSTNAAIQRCLTFKDRTHQAKEKLTKVKTLEAFKKDLDGVENKEELNDLITKFKKDGRYDILKNPQGITIKALGLKTSSVKSFDEMIKRKSDEIDRAQQKNP
jgi:hypothetical protein